MVSLPIPDRSALEALMRRYNQRLFRVARSILKDDAEAEDAVQQAWLAAFGQLQDFRGEAELSTWLTRIAINQALGRARGRKRDQLKQAPAAAGLEAPSGDATPEENVSNRELVGMLEQAIDGLPDGYRVVLVLREVEGLSTAEAAGCLELSEEAVRVRLHRARGMLKSSLERRLGRAAAEVFSFAGERCDRIVRGVLEELARR